MKHIFEIIKTIGFILISPIFILLFIICFSSDSMKRWMEYEESMME